MDRYAVFGNPIEQSKSPFIHTQFASQCGQALTYEAILAPEHGFADSWRSFVAHGGKGGNVTAPFKQQAFEMADVLSARAKLAGAVNTLYTDTDGILHGDNTDGVGLVADLKRLNVNLTNCNVLLLGAGGASRGVIGPLLDAGVGAVALANRTQIKAEQVVQNFDSRVIACSLDQIPQNAYQLVINGTSSGLSNQRPEISAAHLCDCQMAYDLTYSAKPTAFMQWSEQHGAIQQADGLGMLVSQAAEAFYIWRGVRPDVRSVMALLKEQLLR